MQERTIFLAAIELSDRRRADYLDQACGKNQELRRRVEALLRSHDQSEGFLDPIVSPLTLESDTTRLADAQTIDVSLATSTSIVGRNSPPNAENREQPECPR